MSKLNEEVEALFQAAVALETEAQRAAYLNRACPDPELRREVESLLAAHDHPDPLLASQPEPARPTIELALADAKDEAVGTTIGRYKLLERLGEGGCGHPRTDHRVSERRGAHPGHHSRQAHRRRAARAPFGHILSIRN